jgi:hypothetical protein
VRHGNARELHTANLLGWLQTFNFCVMAAMLLYQASGLWPCNPALRMNCTWRDGLCNWWQCDGEDKLQFVGQDAWHTFCGVFAYACPYASPILCQMLRSSVAVHAI